MSLQYLNLKDNQINNTNLLIDLLQNRKFNYFLIQYNYINDNKVLYDFNKHKNIVIYPSLYINDLIFNNDKENNEIDKNIF